MADHDKRALRRAAEKRRYWAKQDRVAKIRASYEPLRTPMIDVVTEASTPIRRALPPAKVCVWPVSMWGDL